MLKKILAKFNGTSEKNKIVIKNVTGAFLVRGLSLCISVFTMPAYIRFFNNESVLGLWFTIISVLNWILNFDLGIGNGLRNRLTAAIANKDEMEARKYISSAYVSCALLSIIAGIVFFAAFEFINWNQVFNIKTDILSTKTLADTVKIVFLSILLQMFFRNVSSILYALQKSSINNFLSLCTSAITLLLVLVLPSGDNEQNMILMAIIHGLAVIVPLIVATICVFAGKTLRNCVPNFKYVKKEYAKNILTLGGTFLYIQIMYMIMMNTNEYLITLFAGSENVVNYQVYSRPFYLGATVFNLTLTPIWSAVGKAFAEKDYVWIKKIYKKLCTVAFISCTIEILIIPFLQPIITLWIGEKLFQVNYIHASIIALLFILQMFNGVFSAIENGMNKLKNQTIIFTIGAILKVPLAWILVQVTGSWIGVICANVILLAIYCIVDPFSIKKFLKEKEV